jgi:predicted transcriptional regulator
MLGAINEAIGALSQRLQRLEVLPWNQYSPDAEMFDHFAGDGTLDVRWATTFAGTGTATLPNATPTYVRLSTGATALSVARLDWAARYPLVGMASAVDMRWRARVTTAVDANAFCEGVLMNSANTRAHTLGVVGSASAAFFAARTIGSTGTQATVSTVAVDTDWHDWRIQTMPDRARFYIDNDLVAEHTLTADTLQTDALAAWLRSHNNGTAADRQMDVDLVWIRESIAA